jgi:tetratricopeptide (TPR) repeat protein
VRSSLRFKCIGVTHEYWGCDDQDIDGKLEELYINDIGDGGSKVDKYERDIRLLTQGLIDEPKNERYYFYLAQSYNDSGDKYKAIDLYKKRIEAGGWNEEVFMAYLRIGDIYNHLKDMEKAVHWWNLAYDYLPSRSETLFRIINFFRINGKNNMALVYLKTALKIDYPKDQVLFIEHPIYQYRLLEELSICGYYTPHKVQGFIACDYLLFSKNVPEVVKQQCYSNLFFYMPKLCPYPITNFSIKVDNPYISSSPSLFRTKKGYSGNIRCVNYSIDKNFKYHIRDENNHVKTKNYWVNLDLKGKVLKQYEIKTDCYPKRESHIRGLEDLRLCKLNNYDLVGLATSFEYGKKDQPSICLCIFDKNDSNEYYIKNIYPTNYRYEEVQKNWAPFYENGNLYAIYCYEPLTILEVDKNNGDCNVVKEIKNELYDLSKIRGSSSPIKMTDGCWLILVHEVLERDTRKYFHRFLLYTKDWELKEIGLPFYFNELFVEFSLSILLNEKTNEITIFFSKEDNSSEMITIKFSEISWIPKDITSWMKNELK